jgi:hypothetical protein
MSAVCLFALLIQAIRKAGIKKAIVAKRAGPRLRALRALPDPLLTARIARSTIRELNVSRGG